MMRKILLLLDCLALVGYAIMHTAIGDMPTSEMSDRHLSARRILEPIQALSQLFITLNPTDAFNPVGQGFHRVALEKQYSPTSYTPVMLQVADRTDEKAEPGTEAEIQGTILAKVAASRADDMAELKKLSRRKSSWREALQVLERLEASPEGAPVRAYQMVITALGKKNKRQVAQEVLERMGDRADTRAYNGILHMLNYESNYDEAMRVWQKLDPANPQIAPNAQSYQKLMSICGVKGRWKQSLELLAELRSKFGDEAVSASHYTGVIRACIKDHRWDEAVQVARQIPDDRLKNYTLLPKYALTACAEAGAPDVATSMVRSLGSKAGLDCHAQSLVACRRAVCLESAHAAWAEIKAAGWKPDELCYAVMVGAILDVAAAQAELADACVDEAMDLAARAVDDLSPTVSPVVLYGALQCSETHQMATPGRQSLRLLHRVSPDLVTLGLELTVLRICVNTGDWDGLASEAAAARQRMMPAWSVQYKELEASALLQNWQEAAGSVAVGAEGAPAALTELQALAADLASLPDSTARESASGSADALERRNARRMLSKTVAIPPDYSVPLDVLYEDNDLLAVSKPIDISVAPVHRSEAESMLNRAVAHLGRVPHPLHRLDAPTSGVLLFAKNVLAAREVSHQFKHRMTEKSYVAMLLGSPEADSFECALPIARHPTQKEMSVVVKLEDQDSNANTARSALTRFEVLSRGTHGTVCLVKPITGRMHQIRVHADYLGHPLAGDPQYGLDMHPTKPNCSRLLLHAYSLCVTHPSRKGRVCFKAPLPDDFIESAALLGVPKEALRAL